jgi:hypothetical protein
MHVLFRATHWCRQWAQLQQQDEHTINMKEACRVLESMVMHIFVNYGWCFLPIELVFNSIRLELLFYKWL